jgi:adenosylcobinamide-GDP ribazoletransferase
MREFFIALQFLTRVPIELHHELAPAELPRSMLYYPAVGLLIGLVLMVVRIAVARLLPAPLVVLIVLILLIVITGGLHLDGFSDTLDGFYAGRNREDILRIMKDSHIGAMGVIGLVCLLLFKFISLQSLGKEVINTALVLMPVLGRWSMVIAASAAPYARSEGVGKPYVGYIGVREWLGATLFTVATAVFLMRLIKGSLLCLIVLLITFMLVVFIKRKIGGMTGDTLGAVGEAVEAVALLTILMLSRSS